MRMCMSSLLRGDANRTTSFACPSARARSLYSRTGLDESVLEKLDRLRISSPKVLPKMRGFSSLSSSGTVGAGANGRTSPSILIRRTKTNPCALSLPSLSIDPHLAANYGGGVGSVWVAKGGLGDSARVPLAPRSDGSSANRSPNRSWRGSVSSVGSSSSLDAMEFAASSLDGGGEEHCLRELFLDA